MVFLNANISFRKGKNLRALGKRFNDASLKSLPSLNLNISIINLVI